jgi:hypothetical protein
LLHGIYLIDIVQVNNIRFAYPGKVFGILVQLFLQVLLHFLQRKGKHQFLPVVELHQGVILVCRKANNLRKRYAEELIPRVEVDIFIHDKPS